MSAHELGRSFVVVRRDRVDKIRFLIQLRLQAIAKAEAAQAKRGDLVGKGSGGSLSASGAHRTEAEWLRLLGRRLDAALVDLRPEEQELIEGIRGGEQRLITSHVRAGRLVRTELEEELTLSAKEEAAIATLLGREPYQTVQITRASGKVRARRRVSRKSHE